jgi:hypothetical protein
LEPEKLSKPISTPPNTARKKCLLCLSTKKISLDLEANAGRLDSDKWATPPAGQDTGEPNWAVYVFVSVYLCVSVSLCVCVAVWALSVCQCEHCLHTCTVKGTWERVQQRMRTCVCEQASR